MDYVKTALYTLQLLAQVLGEYHWACPTDWSWCSLTVGLGVIIALHVCVLGNSRSSLFPEDPN